MRILVTGFEPYDGQWNASKELVRSLLESPLEWAPDLHDAAKCRILSCDTSKARAEVEGLVRQLDPDYCLFIGQAPGRNKVTLERFAQNLMDFNGPDAAGNRIKGEMIEPDGPAAYWSSLPDLGALVQALNEAGIPAAPSNHAGNHLCNQTLYHALHYAASSGHRVRAGFMHVPVLPEQTREQHPGAPFMPLEMLRDAVGVVLNHLVQASSLEANS
jgi:pyroglutamyl-peptidase